MSDNMVFFAEQMRARRKEAGLSQEALSEKTSVSVALISEIERGIANPTVATLKKIAAFFRLELADMLVPSHASPLLHDHRLELIRQILDMDYEQVEALRKQVNKMLKIKA